MSSFIKTATFFAALLLTLTLTLPAQESDFGTLITWAEAEDGILEGVSVASSKTGFSGTGYVTGLDSEGDQVTISLDIPESGYFKVVIRYTNSSEKTENVIINGGFSFPVIFPDQVGFALTPAGNHYLEGGINTVCIQKNWGWTEIDRVEIYPAESLSFNISPALVDPDADSGAKALYEMLKLQFRHRIISGQTDSYFTELETLAGKTPLLRAGDFSSYTEGYPYLWSGDGHILGKDPDGSSERLINWYNSTQKKGIISFQWHWHSPTGGEAGQNNFYTTNTSFDIRQAVIPGTDEYNDIIRDIDDIAVELAKFEDAGIPVLWRPLHEAGGGWFWWGAHGPEACKALYNIMYERLMNHHSLHNLIWVWSTPEESWYPGNDRVDIIGHDSYPGVYNYGNQKFAFDGLFELTGGEKLIAMTENGPIPDPDACLDQGAPWLYFMSWSDLVNDQNSSQHIRDVYVHQDVLTVESENIRTSNEWRSSLYPEHWKPGFRDVQDRFLHDFSYAGYRGGNVPLPEISENIVDISQAPYEADNSGISDVRAVIQQALNDVGTQGGGVVYLPAGTYRITIPSGSDQALHISTSNTILRGAGADSTFLFFDGTYLRHKNIIQVAPAWASWFSASGQTTYIRFDLEYPTRIIPVESVAAYQVGDQVIVRNTATDAFIAEHGMTGMWTAAGIKGVAHKRRIDSIDVDRRLLILDAPTRYPLKTRDAARVYMALPHLQECGLEHFSIGCRESIKSGWEEEDYNSSGTGAYDVHASQTIRFEFTENSWAKNLNSYQPAVNSNDVHLLSNGLLLNMCRHITVDSCIFQKPQYEGGGGNGYMYTLQSNDCLVSHSRAIHARHNYDFKYPFSNGNVIHQCRAENSKYSSDFHMYLSMSNLFDQTTLNGDWLQSAFRPWGDPIHGHSSTQSVFYNTVGENYHPSSDFIVESRQYKWGYVIGTSGPANQVKTDPVSGTEGGYSYDSSPRDFVEGVGEGSDLRPASLYLDQLERRMEDSRKMHTYKVEIVVKDEKSGALIPGTALNIYGESQVTDSEGSALFTEVPESFSLEVQNPRYISLPEHHMLIYSDTLLYIKLEEKLYQLGFELLDELSLEPFWGVSISLNDQVQVTDDKGKAVFTTYAGPNTYSFQKISYRPESGTLDIQKDSLLRFLLTRTHADVKFRLRNGSTPVNDVEVIVDADTLLSNSLGLAKFLQLPVYKDYSYTASREGYELLSGNFYLKSDTTIDLSIRKESELSVQNTSRDWISFWPNPAGHELHCNIHSGFQIYSFQIVDLTGRVLLEQKVTPGEKTHVTIHLEALPASAYLLLPRGDKNLGPVSFIKQ
jgi:Glycosyl hydrolase family 26/Carbohydrate binding module (family 35)/Pectate lyase superfamily protein